MNNIEEKIEEDQYEIGYTDGLKSKANDWSVMLDEDDKKAYETVTKSQLDTFMKCLPPEDKPKLGSENQDIYITYSNGYNDCRAQLLQNLRNKGIL